MSYLISGYEFYKISDWNFCNRYPFNFDYSKIKEKDKVFLNLDFYENFKKELLRHKPTKKFFLISHNSDLTFTKYHLEGIKDYILKIYPINCNFSDDKISKIPIGFVDDKYKPHTSLKNISELSVEKNILLYMNFKINTNIKERQACYDYFKNNDFITIESNLHYEEFYKQIKKSKYVLSPDGTGFDCHRIYESLLLDAIPVIKKNSLSDLYENLPVVIVENWNKITKEYLEQNYSFYLEKLKEWKKENPDWFKAKYWIR